MRKLHQILGLSLAIALSSVGAQAAKVYVNKIVDNNDPTKSWSAVKAYFYKGATDNGWPGAEMTKATGDEMYSIDIPAAYAGGKVIFSDGAGHQYPAGEGLQLGTGSMVCSIDGNNPEQSIWTDYNESPITVYFDNTTTNWATPKCYYWGVKGRNADWPGSAMTLKAGETKIYQVTLPAGTCGIIFNDGAATGTVQSDNFIPKDGHTYTKTGDTAGSTNVSQPFTVYFDNSKKNWSTVKVHYFGATQSEWPGVTMDAVAGKSKIFSKEVPAGTTGVVFTDGSGNQTDDYPATANYIYNGVDTPSLYDPSAPVTVATPDHLYIVGTVGDTFWATTPGIAMTKSGNTYTATNVEIKPSAPGEEFGYFTFLTAIGANWDVVNGSDRYGAKTENAAFTAGEADMQKYEKNVDASSAKSWKLAPGKYTITADFATMKCRVELTGSGPVAGTGALKIENIDVNPGRDATIEIGINNEDPMTSLQFDIELPSCVAAGSPFIAHSLASSHTLVSATVGGSKIRVIVYSASNTPFSANDGTLVYLPVSVAANTAVGEYDYTISGIAYADANLLRVTGENQTAKINVKAASDYQIELNRTVVALQPGNTVQLTATVTPHDGTDETVTWTSLNPTVATVTASGLVVALSNGEANIKATCKGAEAICKIYVGKKSQTITWEQTLTSLGVGDEDIELVATAPGGMVEFTITSGAACASIVNGKLHALAPGMAVITATQDGNDEYAPAEPVSKTVTITLGYIVGDANGDNVVTMEDAVKTVDYILEKNPSPFNPAAANVNGDKNADQTPLIDVVDVALIVKIVLDSEPAQSPAPRRENAQGEQFSVAQDGNSLMINFSNQDNYVATIFELTLPEEVEIDDFNMVGSNHVIASRKISDNTTRIAVYSLTNETFNPNGYVKVNLNSSKNAAYSLDNARIDSTDGVNSNEYGALGVQGTLTGIAAINADAEAPVYFNLQGVRVDNPGTGVYIRVAGKEASKVIIK